MVAVQGESVWAARLWGAAESLRDTLGLPISPLERVAKNRLWLLHAPGLERRPLPLHGPRDER